MAWEKSGGMPIIYNYENGVYTPADPTYFTWQTGRLWTKKDSVAIKFTNDTNVALKIGHVGIKTVACHSGGQSFWAFGGIMSYSDGSGGYYTSFIRVSNDGGNTFQECLVVDGSNRVRINAIGSSNMNSAGTSSTNTAQFGNPPFTGDHALQFRTFNIEDCPVIEPGGIAYIHLKIEPDNTGTTVVIRFVLDTDELDVAFEPGTNPYIWRFCEDGKWHLRKPLYTAKSSSSWKDVEED